MRARHQLRILGGAALLAFLVFLVAMLPARLVLSWFSPAGAQFVDPAGSLWRGSVAAGSVGPLRFGNTSWSLSAAGLLRAQLRAEVDTRIAAGTASGKIVLGLGNHLSCHQCRHAGPLAGLSGWLPMLRELHGGRIHADIEILEVAAGWPRRLVADIRLADVPLSLPGLQAMPEGPALQLDVAVAADPVPADGSINFSVRDAGGPLAIQGLIVLQPPGHYVLDARLAAQPSAPEQLAAALRFLGEPAADGTVSLGLSGSF